MLRIVGMGGEDAWSGSALDATLQLIESPRRFTRRIVETVDLSGDTIQREVVRDLVMPSNWYGLDNAFGRLYVPTLRFADGQVGSVTATDQTTGLALPYLSHAETMNVLSLVVLTAAMRATPGVPEPNDDHLAMAHLVMRPRSSALVGFSAVMGTRTFGGLNHVAANRLHALFLGIISNRFILADIEAGPAQRRQIKVRHEIGFQRFDSETRTGKVKNFLGQRPVKFRMAVSLATETASFHQRVVGPSKYCCYERDVVCSEWVVNDDAGTASRIDVPASAGGDGAWRSVESSNAMELYLKDLPTTEAVSLRARYVFLERSPGPTFAAFILSLFTTLAFGTVALGLDGLLRNGGQSDIPALILALPGAVALAGRVASDDGALVRLSLLVTVSRLQIAFTAVAASLGYILSLIWFKGHDESIPTWMTIAWWELTVLQFGVTLALFGRAVKLWREAP